MAKAISATTFRTPLVTRFAPSLTGRLHLGHVAHAIYVWGIARRFGGRVLLRMEDHDRGRFRPEYEHAILDDLDWLGFAPDVKSSPLRQSDCVEVYERYAQLLRSQNLTYACECTRADVMSESRALPGDEAVYAGRCRERGLPETPGLGLRVKLPDGVIQFDDLRLGRQNQNPQRQCGDMLIRDRSGNWTYQFCVTVDDLEHQITAVIRGEDLLSSTGRQLALRSLLGGDSALDFFHHPLVRDIDDRKLSKRDGDLGLDAMRRAGMSAQDVVRRGALLVGLTDDEGSVSIDNLPSLFAGTG